jgi:hypothetical protein
MLTDRIQEFLQRLTPLTRNNLLTELERLETSDGDMPGTAEVLAKLRSEFRKDGSTQNRISNPSRYFFMPLEPLLVDGVIEHANSGRIQRGSLAAIWEWISRDLLRTMASDYVKKVDELIGGNNPKEAAKVASTFQTKVVKSIESVLSSSDGAEQIRTKLATYTASRTVYGDVLKMLYVLRSRDVLAKFNSALPERIQRFDDAQVAKITALLDKFGKSQAEAIPFALALVATRLKAPWQLIRFATKSAASKDATDVAATPYAIAVSMVLDRLEDQRAVLRTALKNERPLVAKEVLTNIYNTEYALQVRINKLDQSDWGERLRDIMGSIGALVEAEVARFPDNVDHVLASRSLRSHNSLTGRLTYLAWKGRDAVTGGAAHFKKLIG